MNNNDIVELNLGDVAYKMYLPLKDSEYQQELINKTKKPYEYEILQDMVRRIPKNSYILDVGMHIANHSLYFAANGHKVIAFEANPNMIDIARKSIELNHFENLITIHECGVSDKEGVAFFPTFNPENIGGMGLVTKESKATDNDNGGGGEATH